MIGGARQIECTINGLGERAGNTSLEEVVMAVRTRKDFFGLETRIDTTQIVPTSRLVSQITGFVVQPNKAVVGANAFAHASGIHQDGVLKARETYEIMTAEDVGWSANKIVLGKLSGRNAFKQRLKELGIELESEDAFNKAFQRFKDLADKKAEIFDEDLQALVADEAVDRRPRALEARHLNQASGMGESPHAAIVLTETGDERKAESQGDGPVDATFKAIESIAKSGARAAALLGERGDAGHRIAGRGDGAALQGRAHRERRRRGHRHHRRLGQGLHQRAEQAGERRPAQPAARRDDALRRRTWPTS